MKMTTDQKKQLFNSLENRKRELQNVQSKIVNLRILEKNLIKKIKKSQQTLKSETTTGSSLQGIFLNDHNLLISEAEIFGFDSHIFWEPKMLTSEDLLP